jgi:hypothetical protein
MVEGDVAQGAKPVVALVEAGDVVILLPAGVEKVRLALDGDFFQGFQAVGGKTGADGIHPFGAFPAKIL